MTQKRLTSYDRNELDGLPVAGADRTLRGLVKAEFAAGNLDGAFLAFHGIPLDRFGSWVSASKKSELIALLLNDTPSAAPIQAPQQQAPQTMPAAPQAPVAVDGKVAALQALLSSIMGGVDAEAIKAQVKAEIEPIKAGLLSYAESLDGAIKAKVSQFDAELELMRQQNDAARAEMLAGKPTLIEVKRMETGEILKLGRQHFLFPLLLSLASVRTHAFLVGPAGSGKTSVCHAVANALALPFYALSVCQHSTKTDLLGFVVPGTGAYFPTDFRRAFENGGVFVLDEIDNGNANVIAVLNAALANGQMSFPDGMIKRHADFVLVAAGNTYGSGADRLYVGRNQLDAATLDRFAFVDFPYDEGFEAALCGVDGVPSPVLDINDGGSVTADGWLDFVRRARAAVEKLKVRAVISPRASIYGVRLAGAGIGRAWLEKMLIWKGTDAATIEKIRASL